MTGQLRALLFDRRFGPLLATDALAALNQHFFRTIVVIYLVYSFDLAQAALLVAFAGALQLLPFIVCAAIAGQIGDRFEKAHTVRWIKLGEIAAMAVAALALITGNLPLLLCAVVLSGIQAAFFWSLKYSLIPELLEEREIVGANALMAAVTFGLIPLGLVGGALVAAANGGAVAASVVLVVLAVLGWLVSRTILAKPPVAPELPIDLNPWWATAQLIQQVRADPPIFRSILAISWFWLVGGLYLSELPSLYGSEFTGGDQQVLILGITVVSIGIALGALLVRLATSGRISLTPVPFAALVMAIASVDLYLVASAFEGGLKAGLDAAQFFALDGSLRLLLDLTLLSLAAGVFVVPLYALIQVRAEPDHRARTIGATVFVNACFVALAGVVEAVLLSLGGTIADLFLITAIGNVVVAAWVLRRLAAYVLKGFFQAVFRLLYRVEVSGLEHIDQAGDRTLVVVNHVSWLDGPLMMAFLTELPVFAVFTGTANIWWVKPFWSIASIYPVDPTNALATKSLIAKVKEGRPCVIFPEGRLSVTGALMKIYPGPAYIADKADAAIIPVRLDGAEATGWSRLDQGQTRRRWFPKIRITILEPRRLQIDPELRGKQRRTVAGQQLYDIMSDMTFRTTRLGPSLFDALLDARSRCGGSHTIVEDFSWKTLSYDKIVQGAMALGRQFAADTQPGERVAVLLPNVNAAAVVFHALQAFARVPAMLNYSAGVANMEAALTTAEVQVIIASRGFVEQAKLQTVMERLEARAKVIWLEDLRDRIGFGDRLRALWDSFMARRIHAAFEVGPDDPAVVLFTSGSEGRPKGVVLSHRNILANCAQAAARVDYNELDKVFDALPLFHSFGLTAGFILPTLFGTRVFLYPSPLHYKIVPEMVYGSNSTVMFGTNSFLKGYGRAADPYDFRSVRYVFAGAEAIQDDTRDLWGDKFGIRLLEGYGATEAAPTIATNTPMHNRRGTVGRFLPGIEWRLEPVQGIDQGGRLWIKGPNVMLGYFRFEQPGVLEPPEEGWYDTGDIASVDADGYVKLLGRAKRFAKIAGEMVSLTAVEALAGHAAPEEAHAVIGIPDPRKGERLVLVTTSLRLDRATMLETARERGLSELTVPAEILQVEKLPVLGSGKTDYPGIQELVDERLAA